MRTYLAVLALNISGVALVGAGIWLCVTAWFIEMPFWVSLMMTGYIVGVLVIGILLLRKAYRILKGE